MNSIIKTLNYLQMSALFLTAALAGSVSPEAQVPFKGSIQTAEILDFSGFPTAVTSSAVGTGNATQLGRFTVTWDVVIDFTHEGGPLAIGSGTFRAANGDSLFTDILGRGNLTENPDVSFIVEVQTITGGTGRFAGATGGFIRESLSNLVTGFSTGSFNGTIVTR